METEQGSLLLVEDNAATRNMLALLLRDKGHAVVVCGDGKQALELAAARPFDLVLLDVGMPGADGFEVLQSLRQNHSSTALPIVMATAMGQSEMIVRALQMGANDYVTKPYDLPVLLARVQSQLSTKRLVEQKAQLERVLAERNRELESANRQLSEANERMKASLRAAAKIQEALLPRESANVPGVRLAWSFHPCEDLAGDTLNAFALDDHHVALYLLDVSGHGVPAALLSVHLSLILSPHNTNSSLIRAEGPGAGSPVSPAEVVCALNRRFAWDTTDRYFTLVYGVLNCHTGEFRYACAGHPGPVVVSSSSGCRILPPSGPPVGVWDVDYQEHLLNLEPGDRLYLYSDGVTEARDSTGQLYGQARLTQFLARQQGALEGSLSALLADLEAWCGGPAGDDVSILAAEFAPVAQRSGQAVGQMATL